MVRLNITMPDALNQKLDQMAADSDQNKSEIIRKALTLFEVAWQGKSDGRKLALVNKEGNITTEIVGL